MIHIKSARKESTKWNLQCLGWMSVKLSKRQVLDKFFISQKDKDKDAMM